ncbi:MAG: DUF4404 family protein [Planctomycetia bacterium]|nr:DUF4404 family protein [Planctomycetia bacterium]
MPQEKLEKLRRTVAELNAELKSVEPTDPEIQALLQSAMADLAAAMEKQSGVLQAGKAAPAAPNWNPSIVGRLKQAAEHYEYTHPNLSGILGSIVDALAQMGI